MDEFYWKKSHVPAFGSWDVCHDSLPFTECFESARQTGLLGYSYAEDRDLYVAGDLYENDVVTPAVIVVPRLRGKNGGFGDEGKEPKRDKWVICDCDCEMEKPSPFPSRRVPKAIDEDLYKISPHLLRAHKRKMGWGLFYGCLRPSCVC